MTDNADFKRLVRDRMRTTGQNYTAARADVLGSDGRSDVQPTADEVPTPTDQPTVEAQPTADVLAAREPSERSPQWQAAEREHRLVVGRFLRDGRLVQVPMRRKARASVLLELVTLFDPGRDYPEPEVNEILGAVHEDHAFWRRELVNYGYLTRADGIYRLPEQPPVRPDSMAQEIPAWESLWLPEHLGSTERR